jgi:heavy metal translocating P-type ATPase
MAAGGLPLLWELIGHLWAKRFGADLLAGLSIIAAALTHEYLVAAIVILMLSGGQALEDYATRRATRVLAALARRMPQTAHRQSADTIEDITLEEIRVGDRLVVFPHEICPVDGVVESGEGGMDEAYLTGEPYLVRKTAGTGVISGAVNGENVLTVLAQSLPENSRYARIMQVVEQSEQSRPRLRRTAERLGAWYTPLTIAMAGAAWAFSGQAERFLAVLVIATPCPLILAIPVAILGAISAAAERSIIIKRPDVLEHLGSCRTFLFDKTGTLTHGRPALTGIVTAPGIEEREILRIAAAAEQYSKHPLADAILRAAREREIPLPAASQASEPPGKGLNAVVNGVAITITGRRLVRPDVAGEMPPEAEGMECVVLREGKFAALFRFRDEPRKGSRSFISHLFQRHAASRILLVSGDRESEVRHLAEAAGIEQIYFSQSPEQKVEVVKRESELTSTVFVGDGINDAPAMLAATVGIAFGQNIDITAEAADAVILEADVRKIDELVHLSKRTLRIALQSAVGGMALSAAGMVAAAVGFLPPLEGAILQEVVDIAAVLNAVRAAFPSAKLTDY